MSLRIALTIDDAPTVANDSQYDPLRMDRMRQSLQRLGIEHCVAFVVGREAEGQEDILKRWLDSGYELGNHTYTHSAASTMSLREFAESVQRCDSLLRSVGALDAPRMPWFRFPFLDRGSNPRQCSEFAAVLHDMNYTVVNASLQFYDHQFENLLVRALQQRDEKRKRAIGKRYVRVARESITYQARRMKLHYDDSTPHIAFCHFGPTSEYWLGDIIMSLRNKGATWCSLRQVYEHNAFIDFNSDYSRTGFLTDTLPDRLGHRLLRKALRLLAHVGIGFDSASGPRLPYLTR